MQLKLFALYYGIVIKFEMMIIKQEAMFTLSLHCLFQV